jgi:hypothetical protein
MKGNQSVRESKMINLRIILRIIYLLQVKTCRRNSHLAQQLSQPLLHRKILFKITRIRMEVESIKILKLRRNKN